MALSTPLACNPQVKRAFVSSFSIAIRQLMGIDQIRALDMFSTLARRWRSLLVSHILFVYPLSSAISICRQKFWAEFSFATSANKLTSFSASSWPVFLLRNEHLASFSRSYPTSMHRYLEFKCEFVTGQILHGRAVPSH